MGGHLADKGIFTSLDGGTISLIEQAVIRPPHARLANMPAFARDVRCQNPCLQGRKGLISAV